MRCRFSRTLLLAASLLTRFADAGAGEANADAGGPALVEGHPALFDEPWKAHRAPQGPNKEGIKIDGFLFEWPDAKCFVFWPVWGQGSA